MFEKTFLPFVYKEINRIVGPEPERTSEKTGRNVQEKKSNDNDDPRSEPEQDERTFTAFPSNKVLQDPMDQCMKHYFEKLKSVSYFLTHDSSFLNVSRNNKQNSCIVTYKV